MHLERAIGTTQSPLMISSGGLSIGLNEAGEPTQDCANAALVLMPLPAGPSHTATSSKSVGPGDALLIVARRASFESSFEAPGAVIVNGFPALPVSVIEDRTELSIAGHLFVFRSGETTRVHAFDGAEGTRCVLCKRPLFAGDAVLCCRHCGSPHHEGPRADPSASALWCHRYDVSCCRCGDTLATMHSEDD
jgi:hypothetical protein